MIRTEGQQAKISFLEIISGKDNFAVGKLGASELEMSDALHYPIDSLTLKYWKQFAPKLPLMGIFPSYDIGMIQELTTIWERSVEQLDCVCGWLSQEYESYVLSKLKFQNLKLYCGEDVLAPWIYQKDNLIPWPLSIQNKRVLFLSCFSDSIKDNYESNKTNPFFNDSAIIPNYQKIMSVFFPMHWYYHPNVHFTNSIELLAYYCNWLNAHKDEYDIVVCGCGVYGIPIAAYVKSIGKSCLSVGSTIQLMFGIAGDRWDENNLTSQGFLRTTKPLKSETPVFLGRYPMEIMKHVEGGKYAYFSHPKDIK